MADAIPLLHDPQKRSVQETLLLYNVSAKIARHAALIELRSFTPSELRAILNGLRHKGPGLKSFDFAWPGLLSRLTNLLLGGGGAADASAAVTWLKPPGHLVERSAQTGLALCVNPAGEWSLREDGYFAISHVWEEGIQADPGNRGIPLAHVQQIIKRIRPVTTALAGRHAEAQQWIWLDGLAIPGASRALSLPEEELKIAIINHLPSIYRRATAVVVFDALVMQLMSTDLVAVAVCLVCGKWLTRVWTYQEIYLAKKAVVVTGYGFVDFLDVLRRLRALSGNEGHSYNFLGSQPSRLDVAKPRDRNPAKFEHLFLTLARLWGADGKKPSLSQLALSCHSRKTGNDIDYARAFFPVLGLTWRSDLTREEGMELIYKEQSWYAMRLILMHGSPRSSFLPGWAPSYLTGLSGWPLGPEEPLGDIEWQKRGLKRTWHTYKVKSQQLTEIKSGLLLGLDGGGGGGGGASEVLCGCKVSDNERPESISGFQDAIQRQSAHILANENLVFPSRNGLAYVVMLVERNREVANIDEAWVYLTAEVTCMQSVVPPQKTSWLILHESPIGTHIHTGKIISKRARLLSDEAALHGNQTPLHIAAEAGNEATLRTLLDAVPGRHHQIDARDDKGWTPLHAASQRGHVGAARLLLARGAPVDALDASERSPLMVAADEGQTAVAAELLRHGADVNLSSGNASSPLNQALIGRHADTAHALLAAGARPQGRDRYGFDPLLVASKDVGLAQLLFAAGAEPLADLVGGATVLHFAARAGNVPLVELLLGLGVPVDLPEGRCAREETALSRAVGHQRGAAVGALLRHGADPDRVLDDGGWTPVLRAVKIGNYEIVKMLLRHGPGPDVRAVCRPEGWTALHVAAREGHRLVARLLVESGWAVNARDTSGATPLQLTDAAGHTAVADVLRKAGGS